MPVENVQIMKSAAAEGIQLSLFTSNKIWSFSTVQNESNLIGILFNFDCDGSANLLKSVIFFISIF